MLINSVNSLKKTANSEKNMTFLFYCGSGLQNIKMYHIIFQNYLEKLAVKITIYF